MHRSGLHHSAESFAMTPREILHLDTRHLGRSLRLYDEVPSTNDFAASFAHDPDSAGTVFVAEHQTNGRGQYGRLWQARPGSSLLLSILLFPPAELRRPVLLTAWAAVGIARAILELTGAEARIKWPNDLLIGGKKVCGILIEQSGGVVVGLGLNRSQTAADFAAVGLPDATSLGMVSGTNHDSVTVLKSVIHHLDDGYDRVLSGDLNTLENRWKQRIGLVGHQVRIDLVDGGHRFGRLRDMSFDGLELETGEHAVEAILPELIRGLSANF